jgi:hypothetical protein
MIAAMVAGLRESKVWQVDHHHYEGFLRYVVALT